MKYQWRVSKYSPQNRDCNGSHLIDDWSSVSDIGRVYNGQKLTLSEYEKQENDYIESIFEFMECAEINKLRIVEIENYIDEDKTNLNGIENGMVLIKEQVAGVAKAVLREQFWCKLELDNSFYVHFGYDYIMYIGLNRICEETIRRVEQKNMYVELKKSPYI